MFTKVSTRCCKDVAKSYRDLPLAAILVGRTNEIQVADRRVVEGGKIASMIG